MYSESVLSTQTVRGNHSISWNHDIWWEFEIWMGSLNERIHYLQTPESTTVLQIFSIKRCATARQSRPYDETVPKGKLMKSMKIDGLEHVFDAYKNDLEV